MRSSSIMHAPVDNRAGPEISRVADGIRRETPSASIRRRQRRYGAAAAAFNAIGRYARALLLALALIPGVAMGQEQGGPATIADNSAPPEIRILAFGASIVQGYGLPPGAGLTAQLERALTERGHAVDIVNAGVSGDTTAGGLARLDWTLGEEFDIAILALGSNDGLRGLDPADTRANLDAMLTILAQKNLPVLFVGMYAPRNLGSDYVAAFDAIYPALAEQHRVAGFMPFLLEGVALDPALNQPDGIHPNEAGVAVMVDTMLPYLEPLLPVPAAAAAGG
jgi:acyl-CoA thioesterase-1